MSSLIVRSKIAIALIGALLTFLGILVLANPGRTTILVTTIIGWAIAIAGAGTLVAALFGDRKDRTRPTAEIVFGALQLALGLLIIMMPGFFVSYLFVLLGVGVIITGVGDIARANDLRKAGVAPGVIPLALGAITIIAGVIMVIAPFTAASAVSAIAAVSLIVSGVTELYVAFMM